MDMFTIGDHEYPIVAPKGRKGRKATSYVLGQFGDKGEVSNLELFSLFGSDEFEANLPTLLGVPDKVLDEEGDSGEILNALMKCIEKIYESLGRDDVETALKNSEGTSKEEDEKKK